jgi:hypothetical protein
MTRYKLLGAVLTDLPEDPHCLWVKRTDLKAFVPPREIRQSSYVYYVTLTYSGFFILTSPVFLKYHAANSNLRTVFDNSSVHEINVPPRGKY